jgi:hypothetical protein
VGEAVVAFAAPCWRGGQLLIKLVKGAETAVMDMARPHFAKLRLLRPKATRSDSSETYLLASGFRPADDPGDRPRRLSYSSLMGNLASDLQLDLDGFLDWEGRQDERFERLDGVGRMMSGGTMPRTTVSPAISTWRCARGCGKWAAMCTSPI